MPPRRRAFLSMLIKRFQTQRASFIRRCLSGLERQQASRKLRKKKPISIQQLKKCLACIHAAQCSPKKQRKCQSICTK